MTINSDFVMSIENECLTSVLADGSGVSAIDRLFDVLRSLAPTLPGPSGIFNGYGRIYVDCGHLEMAACECDSPFALAAAIESQQRLLAKAVAQLAEEGRRIVVANNNHSGLLQAGCSVWGAHENFFVEQHPSSFAHLILPFLVTRIYQGAGGIEFPTGNFLAAVRPLAIVRATGGGTTQERAIHSTAREEHHMGHSPRGFRYHGILGDGHRSAYNLSLQAGATALTLKAIFFDSKLPGEVRKLNLSGDGDGFWVQHLQRFNRLASPGTEIRVDPLAIRTQRIYLAAAHRYAKKLGGSQPEWIPRTLAHWEETLDGLARMDLPWLSQRLDAFIKYAFYSRILEENAKNWRDLPQDPGFFNELALLDHRYHEFANPKSWFSLLNQHGLLRQRVCPFVEPGQEEDPYVPRVKTRAAARGRWIRENAGASGMVVDWAWVNDAATGRALLLCDPFQQQYTLHRDDFRTADPLALIQRAERILADAQAVYDRGEYAQAERLLDYLLTGTSPLDDRQRRRTARLRAWTRARLGLCDGDAILYSLYRGSSWDMQGVADVCCTLRFRGLVPHEGIQAWLDHGFQILAGTEHSPQEPPGTQALREHAAAALCAAGRHGQASELLELACQPGRLRGVVPRIKVRLLAALGDLCRVLDQRERAGELLRQADELCQSAAIWGDRAEFVWTAMARLETDSARALNQLNTAKQAMRRLNHRMGLCRVMVLEAHIAGDSPAASDCRERLAALREQVPALGQCPRLAAILEHWPAWISGGPVAALPESADRFYGI